MRRRLLLALVLVVVALAGCSTGPDGTTTGAPDGPTTGVPGDGVETGPTTRAIRTARPTATTTVGATTTAETTTATEETTTTTTTEEQTTAPETTTTTVEGTVTATESAVSVRNGPLPVDADRVYDRVEALLGANAPAPTVIVERGEQWEKAFDRDAWNETAGELTVWNVLRSELNRSRADAGAGGWGTDALYGLDHAGNDSRHGHVWAIRWDATWEATEFVGAFRAYAARRSDDTTRRFRVERVGPQTTVVLAGDPTLVAGATVSGSSANVTVTTSG